MYLSPFGFKVPENNDKNWWSYLIFNILRGASHTHNGVDSPLLPSTSFTKTSQNLSFSGWAATTQPGHYKQTVTMPAGITFANFAPLFFVDGGGDDGKQVGLSYIKLSANSFELYSNNAALSLKVLYV